MDKFGYQGGLVRYTTQNALAGGLGKRDIWARILRPRTLIYMSILLCITLAVGLSLALRTPLKVDVIRDRGLPREIEDDVVENVYRLQVMNTDEHPHRYVIEVSGMSDIAISSGSEFDMPAATTRAVPVRVRAHAEDEHKHSIPIRFVVRSKEDASVSVEEKAVFLLPR